VTKVAARERLTSCSCSSCNGQRELLRRRYCRQRRHCTQRWYGGQRSGIGRQWRLRPGPMGYEGWCTGQRMRSPISRRRCITRRGAVLSRNGAQIGLAPQSRVLFRQDWQRIGAIPALRGILLLAGSIRDRGFRWWRICFAFLDRSVEYPVRAYTSTSAVMYDKESCCECNDEERDQDPCNHRGVRGVFGSRRQRCGRGSWGIGGGFGRIYSSYCGRHRTRA